MNWPKNKGNYVRFWICPWNMPIEWTPVKTYKVLLDEMSDFSKMKEYSKNLKIHHGTTPVTQNDKDQLLPFRKDDQYIVYQIDSLQKAKIMLYYKGEVKAEDFQLLVSTDGKKYKEIKQRLSDSWNSGNNWKRTFLYSPDIVQQPNHYLKFVVKKSALKDSLKIAGIQLSHGSLVAELDCNGLGSYSQKNSIRLDSLVQLAENKGIYLMVALGYHGQFNPNMDAWGVNDEWQRNPYNKKNGGPCASPAEFFTNDTARKAYKDYLRYFVARWGYSPAVSVWEFWNEVDIVHYAQKFESKPISDWHSKMAAYLKSIDPYQHPVSSSVCCNDLPGMWDSPYMDIAQIHRYAPTAELKKNTENYITSHDKAHIVGEFAVGWQGPGNDYSVERYNEEFHNGMWRGMFTKVPVLPLTWWWDNLMDEKQYFHLKALNVVNERLQKTSGKLEFFDIKTDSSLEAYQAKVDLMAVIWVKNKDNKDVTQIIPLVNMPQGNYQVEYLNTWNARIEKEVEITSQNSTLEIECSIEANKDVAIIIRKK